MWFLSVTFLLPDPSSLDFVFTVDPIHSEHILNIHVVQGCNIFFRLEYSKKECYKSK